MALLANRTFLGVSFRWWDSRSQTGFAAATQRVSTAKTLGPSAATFNYALGATYTLAASGTQVVDLYSVTTGMGEAATCTKLKGFAFIAEATVTGGVLKVEPGASNPFDCFLAGTSPSVSVPVGTDGAFLAVGSGTTKTLSNTAKNVLLTNTGSQSITVTVAAILGT